MKKYKKFNKEDLCRFCEECRCEKEPIEEEDNKDNDTS